MIRLIVSAYTHNLPRFQFDRLLEPGLAIVIPIVEKIKYVKSLKEICMNIPAQSAITQGCPRSIFTNDEVAVDGVDDRFFV